MRVVRLTASVALLPLLGACASTGSGDNAACVSPYIDDQRPNGTHGAPPAKVSPGDTITLFGHWYADACNDTNRATAPAGPLPPVRLTLTLPDGTTRDLGMATPKCAELGFTVTVQVPQSASAGTASVSDNRARPATYHFTVKTT